MSKAQFVPLAHVYEPGKHSLAGKLLSEKLDGMRFLWDGGASRGVLKSEVPYANCIGDERLKKPEVATGLWSRYGNVVHAPAWFLDQFPKFPLDGELYAGHGMFQFVMSAVKKIVPIDWEWQKIQARVLDAPPIGRWLEPRTINETQIKLTLTGEAETWWRKHYPLADVLRDDRFENRLLFLKRKLKPTIQVFMQPQIEIPFNTKEAEVLVNGMAKEVVADKGEGVIVKSRNSLYLCERTYDTLKVKPRIDAEGIVKGYIWGDLPDNKRSKNGDAKGKLIGLMGSALVQFNGVTFKLSGFTDEERKMIFIASGACAADVGIMNPGKTVTEDIEAKKFPRGTNVTFSYRELSKDRVPREAAFDRIRYAE